MSDLARGEVRVYENGKCVASRQISYFHSQPYAVKIDTPDGTDWKYERTACSSGSPDVVPDTPWLLESQRFQGKS